jgi:hypothetical protein
MATIDELFALIAQLQAQLEVLEGKKPSKQTKWEKFLKWLKDFPKIFKEKNESPFAEFLQHQKMEELSDIGYQKCNEEIFQVHNQGKTILHEGKDRQIQIEFNFSDNGNLSEIFDGLKEYRIEIIDKYKINHEIEKIIERQKKNGIPSGGGMGGVPPEYFLNFAQYILAYVIAPWFIKHLLGDLDDYIWTKIKGSIIKVYKLVRKLGKKDEKIIIVTSYKIQDNGIPTISFEMPTDLLDEDVEVALEKIPGLSKTATNTAKNENKDMISFIYDKKGKDWTIKK